MSKTAAISAVVVLAVLGLSAYSYTVGTFGPLNSSLGSSSSLGSAGTGSLSIYMTDSPHSFPTLKYLLLNVSSVTLRYSSLGSNCSGQSTTSSTSTSETGVVTSTTSTNSTHTNSSQGEGPEHTFVFVVPPSVGTNVNITSLHGQGLLLGATNPPVGEVVKVTLGVSGAEAFWTSGPPTQLMVVANGKLMIPVHFAVNSNGSTTLTIDVTPSDIHISEGNMKVLTPVVHVTVGQSGGCEQETQTTTTTSTSANSTVTSTTSTSNSTSVTTTFTSSTNSTTTAVTSSTNSTTTSTTTTSTNSTTT